MNSAAKAGLGLLVVGLAVGVIWTITRLHHKAVSAPATGQPWTNSLGMEFVPVPGVKALFSKWETRVQDYQAFADATSRTWERPGFDQAPTHPAVNASWEDAQAFCHWLTEKETKAGRLSPGQSYRLPRDWEWSAAVGLDERKDASPKDKDGKIPDVYPWGTGWPPPAEAGNYHGQEAKSDPWPAIDGFGDRYIRTSPAGSFKSNKYGLYDMGGNVWEWCEDYFDGQSGPRVQRGGAWDCAIPGALLSSHRHGCDPGIRFDDRGFRVVLGWSARN